MARAALTGIDLALEGTALPASRGPTSQPPLPLGTTVAHVVGGTWPNTGIVVTHNFGDSPATCQVFTYITGFGQQYRVWNDIAKTWRSWTIVPTLATVAPLAPAAVGAVGASISAAKGDHAHPEQTSVSGTAISLDGHLHGIGLVTQQGDTTIPSTPPSLYPPGISYRSVSTTYGWPETGTVVTAHRAAGFVWQTLIQQGVAGASPRVQYRAGATDSDAWTAWVQLNDQRLADNAFTAIMAVTAYPAGHSFMQVGSTWTAEFGFAQVETLHNPPSAGASFQRATTIGPAHEVWVRRWNGSAWQAWTRIDGHRRLADNALPSTASDEAYPDGYSYMAVSSGWTAEFASATIETLHNPPTSGHSFQRATTVTAPSTMWLRRWTGTAWQAWTRTDRPISAEIPDVSRWTASGIAGVSTEVSAADHRHSLNLSLGTVAHTVLPDDTLYPIGVYTCFATTAQAWPVNGVVSGTKYSQTSYHMQILSDRPNTGVAPVYRIRSGLNGNTWSPWRIL